LRQSRPWWDEKCFQPTSQIIFLDLGGGGVDADSIKLCARTTTHEMCHIIMQPFNSGTYHKEGGSFKRDFHKGAIKENKYSGHSKEISTKGQSKK
jgi:hypothetical protein